MFFSYTSDFIFTYFRSLEISSLIWFETSLLGGPLIEEPRLKLKGPNALNPRKSKTEDSKHLT
jgi:hypothetical protein